MDFGLSEEQRRCRTSPASSSTATARPSWPRNGTSRTPIPAELFKAHGRHRLVRPAVPGRGAAATTAVRGADAHRRAARPGQPRRRDVLHRHADPRPHRLQVGHRRAARGTSRARCSRARPLRGGDQRAGHRFGRRRAAVLRRSTRATTSSSTARRCGAPARACPAPTIMMYVRTRPGDRKHDGISLVLVDADAPGRRDPADADARPAHPRHLRGVPDRRRGAEGEPGRRAGRGLEGDAVRTSNWSGC